MAALTQVSIVRNKCLGFIRYFTNTKHHFRYIETSLPFLHVQVPNFQLHLCSHCISLHYELRDSQLKIYIYQPNAKQENSHFHCRLQVTFRSRVALCSLPWWPFSSSSLPSGDAGTACKVQPCLIWRRWLIGRWEIKAVIGPMEVRGKVIVFYHLLPKQHL